MKYADGTVLECDGWKNGVTGEQVMKTDANGDIYDGFSCPFVILVPMCKT